MPQFSIRIIITLFIFLSIFIFPWWFPFVLTIFCLFIFKNYFESLFVGFSLDILYGPTSILPFKIIIPFTFITAITLIITFFAKRNLSMYKS